MGGVYVTQILPFADVKSLPLFYAFQSAWSEAMTYTDEVEEELRKAIRKFLAAGGSCDELVALICSAYGLTAIPPAGSSEHLLDER